MNNNIIKSLLVIGILSSSLSLTLANEEAAPVAAEKPAKKVKEKPPVVDLTISGTISKVEKANKQNKVITSYVLKDTDGNTISLPTPKAPKKNAEAAVVINLDDYLNANVTVIGKGIKIENPKKTVIKFHSITTIEKQAAEVPVVQEAVAE